MNLAIIYPFAVRQSEPQLELAALIRLLTASISRLHKSPAESPKHSMILLLDLMRIIAYPFQYELPAGKNSLRNIEGSRSSRAIKDCDRPDQG